MSARRKRPLPNVDSALVDDKATRSALRAALIAGLAQVYGAAMILQELDDGAKRRRKRGAR